MFDDFKPGIRLALSQYPFVGKKLNRVLESSALFHKSQKKSNPDAFRGNLYGPFEIPSTFENGIKTNVRLKRGQRFRICSFGQISIDGGFTWIRPSGIDMKGKEHFHNQAIVSEHPLGTMVFWIDGGTRFVVRDDRILLAEREGALYLGVNDTRGMYSDNLDSLGQKLVYLVLVEILD